MKKKILFIVQLPPPVHGASIMNKQIIENHVIKQKYNTEVINLVSADDLSELGGASLKKILKSILIYINIFDRIFKFRPDLIFINYTFKGPGFYRDLIFIPVIKLFKIKTVFYLQGKGIKEISEKNKLKKYIYKSVFKNSYVISLSNLLIDDIKDVYSGTPFVINNCIPAISFDKFDISQKENIVKIIYLSALSEEKGVLALLDAAKILKDRKLKFIVNIVGSSHTMPIEYLITYIENNKLESICKLLGPKYGDDKYNELLNSDIFVFPTKNEAFGLVNLEAMMCGLPVISTFEGAIPEIIEDNVTGFLVNKSDNVMLADKIQFLLENPDIREKMGNAGRERYFNKYTMDVFDRNVVKVFDSLLK